MAEQNPIRYQDLITPDDSIEKLISQLEELQQSYTNMANTVKAQAQQVADSLTKVSGATEQGRKKIKESSDEATKLEKAYKRLDEAMSANGKEIQKLNRARQEYTRYQKNIQQRGQQEIRTLEQIKNASYQQSIRIFYKFIGEIVSEPVREFAPGCPLPAGTSLSGEFNM